MFSQANMLVLKVTRDCNLRCKYCYITDKDEHRGEIINFDTFKKIIDQIVIDKVKNNRQDQQFTIVFHGGEPTLLSRPYFAKLCEYIKYTFNQYGVKYNLSIQTNMTMLDEEYMQLFAKYGIFNIGCSFDGFKKDSMFRSKRINDNLWDEKYKLAKKYGIELGPLIVVNKNNVHTVIKSFRKLSNKYGIIHHKANYAEDVIGDGNIEVSGKEFFENVYKPDIDYFTKSGECYNSNVDMLLERFFMLSIFETPVFMNKTNCYSVFCGAGINVIEIEPNGDLFLCGRYSKQYPEVRIKNVADKDFLELHQIKKYMDFLYEKNKYVKEAGCDECPARHTCDGGCMAFHYSRYGEFGIRTDLTCDIHKMTYNYMMLKQYEIVKTQLDNIIKKHNGERKIAFESFIKRSPMMEKIYKEYKITFDGNTMKVEKI